MGEEVEVEPQVVLPLPQPMGQPGEDGFLEGALKEIDEDLKC